MGAQVSRVNWRYQGDGEWSSRDHDEAVSLSQALSIQFGGPPMDQLDGQLHPQGPNADQAWRSLDFPRVSKVVNESTGSNFIERLRSRQAELDKIEESLQWDEWDDDDDNVEDIAAIAAASNCADPRMKDGVAYAIEQECGLSDIVEDDDSWDTLTSLASTVEQTALKDLSSRSMDFIVDGLPPSGVSVESVSVVENQVDAPSDVITRPELLLDSYASTASAQASLLAFQDEVEAEPSYASVEVPSSKGVKAAVIQVPSSVHDRSSQVRSNTSADNTDTYNTGQWIVECDAYEAISSLPTAIINKRHKR